MCYVYSVEHVVRSISLFLRSTLKSSLSIVSDSHLYQMPSIFSLLLLYSVFRFVVFRFPLHSLHFHRISMTKAQTTNFHKFVLLSSVFLIINKCGHKLGKASAKDVVNRTYFLYELKHNIECFNIEHFSLVCSMQASELKCYILCDK